MTQWKNYDQKKKRELSKRATYNYVLQWNQTHLLVCKNLFNKVCSFVLSSSSNRFSHFNNRLSHKKKLFLLSLYFFYTESQKFILILHTQKKSCRASTNGTQRKDTKVEQVFKQSFVPKQQSSLFFDAISYRYVRLKFLLLLLIHSKFNKNCTIFLLLLVLHMHAESKEMEVKKKQRKFLQKSFSCFFNENFFYVSCFLTHTQKNTYT